MSEADESLTFVANYKYKKYGTGWNIHVAKGTIEGFAASVTAGADALVIEYRENGELVSAVPLPDKVFARSVADMIMGALK